MLEAILTIQFRQDDGDEEEALMLIVIVPEALFMAAVVKVAYPEPSPTMKPPKTSKSSFGPLPKVTVPCFTTKVSVALGAVILIGSVIVQAPPAPLNATL